MKVIGGGKIEVYEPIEEGPHNPGPHETWQESIWLHWWDLEQSVGGIYRIGHETNWQTGPKVATWNTTYSPLGIYKHTTYLPLLPASRISNGLDGDEAKLQYRFEGQCVFTMQDADIDGELRFHDFHPSIDCYPKHGQVAEFAPKHIEVSGTVNGRLTIKGHTYDIVDALAFRDHGWGRREWGHLLSHRWIAGAFGPDLSFCALTFHSVDDALVQVAWIVRHDTLTYTSNVDIVTFLDTDGVSVRGGALEMTLTTGEVLNMTFEAVAPSSLSYFHTIGTVDTLCKVTCGERVGVADFQISNNPQQGDRPPKALAGGITDSGWHPPQAAKLLMR